MTIKRKLDAPVRGTGPGFCAAPLCGHSINAHHGECYDCAEEHWQACDECDDDLLCAAAFKMQDRWEHDFQGPRLAGGTYDPNRERELYEQAMTAQPRLDDQGEK